MALTNEEIDQLVAMNRITPQLAAVLKTTSGQMTGPAGGTANASPSPPPQPVNAPINPVATTLAMGNPNAFAGAGAAPMKPNFAAVGAAGGMQPGAMRAPYTPPSPVSPYAVAPGVQFAQPAPRATAQPAGVPSETLAMGLAKAGAITPETAAQLAKKEPVLPKIPEGGAPETETKAKAKEEVAVDEAEKKAAKKAKG